MNDVGGTRPKFLVISSLKTSQYGELVAKIVMMGLILEKILYSLVMIMIAVFAANRDGGVVTNNSIEEQLQNAFLQSNQNQ